MHKERSSSIRKKNRSRHPPSIVNWPPGAKLFQLPPSIYPPPPSHLHPIYLNRGNSFVNTSILFSLCLSSLLFFFYCLASFPFSSLFSALSPICTRPLTYDIAVTSSRALNKHTHQPYIRINTINHSLVSTSRSRL